jgi:hypothetical protein
MNDLRTLPLFDLYNAMKAATGEERKAALREVKRRTKLCKEKNKRTQQKIKAIKQQMKMAGIK